MQQMSPPTEVGARCLFDGMPQSKKALAAFGADRISALPDSLVHRVLGFLQAREVVQTCVLARRWRHLWKSMPVLRVTCAGTARALRKFMDHLLLLLDRSSLDECLFEFIVFSEDDVPYVNLWIWHALLWQVRVLSVGVKNGFPLPLDDLPVVSQYLNKLDLLGLRLYGKFLDFSSCQTLKALKMTRCSIYADKIYSKSLKRLSFHECSFTCSFRTCIAAPSLISLLLIKFRGATPLLEDMPLLVTAVVRFCSLCEDFCDNSDPGYCEYASCEACSGIDNGSAGCVLLKGLSAARNLKLIADPEMFILKRDLRWCPTFRKLEILVLSEWCVVDDHRALICILQHSPVLKKLTLQLYKKQKPKSMMPPKAIYNSVEQSFASDNLKTVEVKCHDVDQRVHNILKSLVTYGISLEKISIQQRNKSSECFSPVHT